MVHIHCRASPIQGDAALQARLALASVGYQVFVSISPYSGEASVEQSGEGLRIMKIVALGGCGVMGRRAVRYFDMMNEVDEWVIADLHEDRARAFSDEIGTNSSAVGIDVMEHDKLVALLKDADLVLNTVGPFYKFGVPILKAAIAAGCHYVDINDDWEPTVEMLELDGEAKAAGISAMINMGGSPGMSNMLAKWAIEKLDTAETLYVCFHMDGVSVDTGDVAFESGEAGATAAAVHSVQQMTGTVLVREGGEFIQRKPLEKRTFSDVGVGASGGVILGHPEPVTLPRYFASIAESACLVMGDEAEFDQLRGLMSEVDQGNLNVSDAAALLEAGFADRPTPEMSAPGDPGRGLSPLLLVYAAGLKGGQKQEVVLRMSALPGNNSMADMTGIPMAVGASLLVQGHVSRKGVFAPEAALDSKVFFDRLASYTTPRQASADALILETIV